MNDLHLKKVMLSVWWNMAGVVHWELLSTGSTVTAEYYCKQLDLVANEFRGKQDKVFFLHDNTRPRIANTTLQKLLNLGWTVLPHPPYSPDLAPTDYHLFRSLRINIWFKLHAL
jgi:histone-lysine N-methyltransferase SETMAR